MTDKELDALHTPIGTFDEFYKLVGKKKYQAFWWRVGKIRFTKKRLEEIRLKEGGW